MALLLLMRTVVRTRRSDYDVRGLHVGLVRLTRPDSPRADRSATDIMTSRRTYPQPLPVIPSDASSLVTVTRMTHVHDPFCTRPVMMHGFVDTGCYLHNHYTTTEVSTS